MPHMLSLNNAVPLGLEQQISITHICHLFFSQEKVNKHANGQTTFNLTKSDFTNTTQGYHADAPSVQECYCSPYTVCIAVIECVRVFSCTVCQSVCTHFSAHFPGNSMVDLSIVSHNPMFCRWDVQTPSMPLCLFFPLPLYRKTGKQMIILWTHYSAWSSYHNQPSWVSNLGSAKLCSVYNVAFVSVLLFFFSRLVRGREVRREGERKRQRERERERGRERDCLHTFAHLSLGIFYQSEIRQVCGRVSILGTQWTTHKGFISSYLLPTPFQGTAHSFSPLFHNLSMSCLYHNPTQLEAYAV